MRACAGPQRARLVQTRRHAAGSKRWRNFVGEGQSAKYQGRSQVYSPQLCCVAATARNAGQWCPPCVPLARHASAYLIEARHACKMRPGLLRQRRLPAPRWALAAAHGRRRLATQQSSIYRAYSLCPMLPTFTHPSLGYRPRSPEYRADLDPSRSAWFSPR